MASDEIAGEFSMCRTLLPLKNVASSSLQGRGDTKWSSVRGWRDTRPDNRIASTERPAQVAARCVEQHGCHWNDPSCSFPSEGLVPAHTSFLSCSAAYLPFSLCFSHLHISCTCISRLSVLLFPQKGSSRKETSRPGPIIQILKMLRF